MKEFFNLEWKEVTTDWLSDKKPSRIYVSNGGTGRILSFYDIKNDISNEEISNNRIATFKNIFNAIVNLKITDAEKSLKEDIIKLNHYTNLRPLWAIDNIRKSNKI